MKPIIFINPEELLEKGRPAAAYGQRKMQQQKRKKKNAKGETVVVMQWVWMKKGHKKWEYDGMVSPSEKKVYDLTQRKTKKGDKLKTQTAARVKEAKAQAAADAAANATTASSGPYVPTAAEIAAMPKKEQVYWDDPDVTKSRRELCDVTGILTMDDESEKYVRDNMKTIFTMSKEQKKLLTDLNINVPAGTDGKAFDDPIFIEDTLDNLKSMYAMQMSKKEKEKREAHLRTEYLNYTGYNEYSSEDDYLAKAEIALKETFEDMIEMFEKKSNDLILLNKMAAWDKGVRGIKNMSQFDTMLARNILGEYPNKVSGPMPWSTLTDEVRTMLGDYNIGPVAWEQRNWGASEVYGFQMATLNDEFRKNVFQPWLAVYGNLITRKEGVQTEPAGSNSLIRKQDIFWYEEALPGERIDVDINILSHKASVIQSRLNPLTVQFMQDNFEYKGVMWDTDTMSEWKKKITEYGVETRNQALHEVATRGHVNLWSVDTIRDDRHKPSFRDSMAQDFGAPASNMSDTPKFGVKRSATWRDFANGVKAMQRRKGFGSENSVDLQAIADTGKALGNTEFHSTEMVVINGFRTFHNSVSKRQKDLVTIPPDGSLERFTSPPVGRLSSGGGIQSLPSNGYYRRSAWHNDRTKTIGIGTPTHDVDLNAKKGDQSLLQYTKFQKTPSSSWRSSYAGKNKRKRVAYSVSTGAQGVGGAVKASFVNYAARLDYDNMHRSEPFNNSLKQHVRASITTSIASNWQLRNMTKNDDIIPNWKWNPATVPFGDKNTMSRTNGVTAITGNNSGPGYISHTDFDRIVQDQYKNSVADTLGLRPSMKTLTTGKLKPSIVLKTSKETPAEALADINKHWSHASNTGVTLRGGHWASGSVKVNHVFDIMYHDYFDDYKQREKDKGNVQYAYHGTDFKAAASIMKGGYIVPRNAKNGRMFGDGVYMAKSSSKSLQYLREMGFGRSGNKGPLLVNRIAMGKTTDPLNPRAGIYDSSVDTVFAGGKTGADPNSFLGHDEWCVKDPKAIVPIKWIEVET